MNPTPVPFSKLKVGEILVIVAGVIALAKAAGFITPTGDFDGKKTPEQWADFAAKIVALLQEQNVDIPANVAQAVAALRFVLPLIIK